MEEIKLTEDQAYELINTLDNKHVIGSGLCEIIMITWREKGFIKKTALEKARGFKPEIISYDNNYENVSFVNRLLKAQKELYEKAIEEMTNK